MFTPASPPPPSSRELPAPDEQAGPLQSPMPEDKLWGGVPVLGVWAPETVEAVVVYQLPVAEGADMLPGGDTPPSDIGTNPNDSHNPRSNTG